MTTQIFERQAAMAGLNSSDIDDICVWLSENPLAGVVVPGTGGARKVRFAGHGKGKSGGYRTLHFYAGEGLPIFLLAVIDKRKTGNITKAERNALAEILNKIAETYVAGMKASIAIQRRRI